MIISVNPNPAVDRTLVVPEFALEKTIRASQVAIGVGGKAACASWVLGELGIPSTVLAFAAGHPGHELESLLRRKGVKTNFIWVKGETRVHFLVVCEDGSGQSTFGVDTLEISDADVEELHRRYTASLKHADAILIGSTLPKGRNPELYTEFVREARSRNIPVVFDCFGPFLEAALQAGPTIIKPNQVELEGLVGRKIRTLKDARKAGQEILDKFGTMVVATMGSQGAVAVLEGRAYQVPPPKVPKVVSTAGTGDAVLAGLTYAAAFKRPMEEGLIMGFAAAGGVLQTLATADCRREDVEKLIPTIELIPL